MPTFISGTDLSTLQEEGSDMNNFLSLIVNNAGQYTAAITRKVKHIPHVTETLEYEFFGDGTINILKIIACCVEVFVKYAKAFLFLC